MVAILRLLPVVWLLAARAMFRALAALAET